MSSLDFFVNETVISFQALFHVYNSPVTLSEPHIRLFMIIMAFPRLIILITKISPRMVYILDRYSTHGLMLMFKSLINTSLFLMIFCLKTYPNFACCRTPIVPQFDDKSRFSAILYDTFTFCGTLLQAPILPENPGFR